MLHLFLALAIGQTPQCDTANCKAACPSCPRAAAPACAADCHCVFPGQCGHPGCACKVVSGLARPSVDRWVPFTANPTYEVYGHEIDGVFRYSRSRLAGTGWPPVSKAQGGATFVICRYCGQTQFSIYAHQQCSRCGMFLPRVGASTGGCPNGQCPR